MRKISHFIYLFIFGFPRQASLMRTSTNPCLRWEPATGHRVLQLRGLELGSKPSRTSEPYPFYFISLLFAYPNEWYRPKNAFIFVSSQITQSKWAVRDCISWTESMRITLVRLSASLGCGKGTRSSWSYQLWAWNLVQDLDEGSFSATSNAV